MYVMFLGPTGDKELMILTKKKSRLFFHSFEQKAI